MNEVFLNPVSNDATAPASDETGTISSHLDQACGELIQRVIRRIKPKVGVEVGLAFGVSTLYILEAFQETGSQKLIGMDPAQHDDHWRGGGLRNVDAAGYSHLYEFHESTSQQVLPELARRGVKIDFAFIDGWHTFDHTLIDFFYIDQMMNVGGVVIFDDVGYPAIKRVCDFILTNRAYDIYDSVRLDRTSALQGWGKSQLRKVIEPLVRTDKTPDALAQQQESRIRDVYFLALEKTEDDIRRWDHFVHF